MQLKESTPRKAPNKSFLKVKPNRVEIETFKTNLIALLDGINNAESEEFHKNLVSDFLKDTYYKQKHFINTKNRNGLVIHNGNNADSSVGVIIEAKKITSKAEMLSKEAINKKAFQELVLYYLRERITHKNLEIKHLVATNINEWFVFDATLFDRLFAQNKDFVKQFEDFEGGRLADTETDFFYKQIAEPFIANIKTELEFTYFNIQDYQAPLRNEDKSDDKSLIPFFKLLSPEHLLKLPFANDSNSLDKQFYSELLHIIGLTETKEGNKKVIQRNKADERHSGSIVEDAIIKLDSLDKLSRLDNSNQSGNTQEERFFTVGIELCITWINRILFLKLLEAQLIRYHKGDKSYSFLNLDRIKNYNDLNSLFFQVLARKDEDRNQDVKQAFKKVPYLNSSLFEPTEMEQKTLFISNLDDKTIPIFSSTVLKDQQGKKRTGNINTLEYLFEFLNAYDFSSEGSEEIQEDNKTLINASVLGLIFEKINGYKDGSFFTPGFITMYMCRETIRKAVVQKFNQTKQWNCTTIEALYDKIEDRTEANSIVNSIKICDPAVGSGHFLVSALNEMIAVKNDLKILQDRTGKRLKEYHVEVVNDELVVTDEEGKLFDYNPNNKESQRIQETLFHEKQTLIENCLFGVDINPNSVKICRLRLWIELLKNAYYISSSPTLGNVNTTKVSHNSSPTLGEVSEGRRGHQLNNLPHLKTFRKELRNNLTPAEVKLWTMLKGKQMEGRKFRRQHSFANYILDFYCPEERIAIELDGQGHFEVSQAEYDSERDLVLEYFGIRVLRLENKWVWDNPDGLLEKVKSYFGKQPPRPTYSLPSKGGELRELQILPNIDINIKCGNSLVSRFAIDADLGQALKNSKWTIDSYKTAVDTYRNAENKEQKREMEKLIADIKADFRSEISLNDPKVKKLRKLSGELFKMTQQTQLFERSKKEKADWDKKVAQLTQESKKLETEIEEIKANKIFENAFEWRFEFPDVLNDDGDFVGFDAVIGNPPYFAISTDANLAQISANYKTFSSAGDIYSLFIELSLNIISVNSISTLIISNKWMRANYGQILRKYIVENTNPTEIIDFGQNLIFDSASVHTAIISLQKAENKKQLKGVRFPNNYFDISNHNFTQYIKQNTVTNLPVTDDIWNVIPNTLNSIKLKAETKAKVLKDWDIKINFGIKTGLNDAFIIDNVTKNNIISEDKSSIEFIKPILRGRDTRKYYADFKGLWLLNFPKGYTIKTNTTTEPYPRHTQIELDNAWDFFQNKHKAVANHLRLFQTKAEKREDKGDYWWELRACTYSSEFDKPKIIFSEIVSEPQFYYDEEGYYPEATVFFISGNNLKYLTALLNSKMVTFLFKTFYTGGELIGKIRYKKAFLENVPLPIPTTDIEILVNHLVDQIAILKKANPQADTTHLENQIDQLVYDLYGLTSEEISIVEGK